MNCHKGHHTLVLTSPNAAKRMTVCMALGMRDECLYFRMAWYKGRTWWLIHSVIRKHNDDDIKWKHFPRYRPFVREIHRSPVNSPHKGQWRGALMFSMIFTWINGWVNNGEAGDLRRHRAPYDVTVMTKSSCGDPLWYNTFYITFQQKITQVNIFPASLHDPQTKGN